MSAMDFEEVVRCYADMVFRIALNISGNYADSEDVMQNVFFRYLKKQHTFSSQDHIKAWLIRVAVNESKRLIKANSKRMCSSLDELENIVFSHNEDSKELFYQVMNLQEKYRTVLYLYYYEGLSLKEIARILKRKEATVRTQLSRAREMLKIKIKEEDYD